jgi:hypothetical protein
LTTFVRDRLIADLTPAKQMAMSLTVIPFYSEWDHILEYVVEHPMVLSHDSPMRQFALALHTAQQTDRTGFVHLTHLANYFSIAISNTADFSKAWDKVYKQYPMLKICERNRRTSCTMVEEINIMTEYIRSVDEQRKRLVLTNVVAIDDAIEIETDEREVVNG